jgi:glutamate carboxypeptidase
MVQATSTADLLDGIRAWVEIETPTGQLDGLDRQMSLVAAQFSAAGARVSRIPGRDGHGDHLSIESRWGTGPGVLVLCHLDTVHPVGTLTRDLPFRVEGDRAYGPGICDMKGGAFAAFAAFREVSMSRDPGPLPVRFLVTSDEEVGSPTSRALIEQAGEQAKYVLVTEAARDGGKIVIARKGVGRYVLTAHGRPSHAGARHQDGRSAILELARQIVRIEGMTDYQRGITFNVGQIFGGTADNVVPAKAIAHIDMRVMTIADAGAMDTALRTLKAHDPDIRLEVEGGLNRPPYEKNDAVARLFDHAKRLAAEIDIDLVGVATGGGSDGNFTAHKVATLDGLGVDGHGAHTLEEHIFVSSIRPRTTLLKRLMQTLA